MPQQSMMPLGGNMDPAAISLGDKMFLPQETMEVPINLVFDPNTTIYSLDLEIHYNSDVLSVQAITSEEMVRLNDMEFSANDGVPGIIKIGLAGAYPMVYDGTVAVITFTSESLTCSPEALNLVSTRINEGAVPVITSNGSIALSPYRSDFSRSCSVGIEDIVLFAEKWLQYPVDPLFDVAPILNLDGKIDLADFYVLAQEWLSE